MKRHKQQYEVNHRFCEKNIVSYQAHIFIDEFIIRQYNSGNWGLEHPQEVEHHFDEKIIFSVECSWSNKLIESLLSQKPK